MPATITYPESFDVQLGLLPASGYIGNWLVETVLRESSDRASSLPELATGCFAYNWLERVLEYEFEVIQLRLGLKVPASREKDAEMRMICPSHDPSIVRTESSL